MYASYFPPGHKAQGTKPDVKQKRERKISEEGR